MRRLPLVLLPLLLAALAWPSPAEATFPLFLRAQTLSPRDAETFVAGGYGNTDADYWAAVAGARYGLLRSIEVGARAGALWVEAPDAWQAAPVVGADVKVQVLRESIDIPLDFAVDVAWTVARPRGNTWSDLAFTALFGKRVRADWVGDRLTAVVGAQLVFLGGSARPGREESAAYGVVGVEVALGGGLALVPEAKFGSDTVVAAGLRYRF